MFSFFFSSLFLAAVTRLLILADMLDVRNLMRLILFLESELDQLKNAQKPEEMELVSDRWQRWDGSAGTH